MTGGHWNYSEEAVASFGERLAEEPDPVVAAAGQHLMAIAACLKAADHNYSGDAMDWSSHRARLARLVAPSLLTVIEERRVALEDAIEAGRAGPGEPPMTATITSEALASGRKAEQWAGMVPESVADGSRAMIVQALRDAKTDIAALVAQYDNLLTTWAESRKRHLAAEARADALAGALEDARTNGLTYWEPQTERGHVAKAQMLARIEAALAAQPAAQPAQEKQP